MGRSIKKGPFIAPELLKRVEELNAKGEKQAPGRYRTPAPCRPCKGSSAQRQQWMPYPNPEE